MGQTKNKDYSAISDAYFKETGSLMKISIIIPVYQVEPYIEDCLKSVMRQTYQGELECILVDDCCTDQSMVIAEKLISDYEGPIVFRVLHHQKNRGLSAARNTAMDIAQSDYLFFLDSDDMMADDCLERLSEPLKACRYDVVTGDTERVDDKGGLLYKSCSVVSGRTRLGPKDIMQGFLMEDLKIEVWNKLFRTGFVRKNKLGFLEGVNFEDVLWTFYVACLAQSLYTVNHITYFNRYRQGSIMTSVKLESIVSSLIEIVMAMGAFVKKNGMYNGLIHQMIHTRFHQALILSVGHPLMFIHGYRQMRKCARPSLKELVVANGRHVKSYLREIHYLLPPCLAAYYELCVIRLLVSVKQVK